MTAKLKAPNVKAQANFAVSLVKVRRRGITPCYMAKQKTIGKLKSDLWKHFSIYVRQSHANWQGYVSCFTCDKKKHWKEVDAGHYISRGYSGTFVDERNVKPQCKGCNGPRRGMHDVFGVRLEKLYGHGVLQELQTKKNSFVKWDRQELQNLLSKYKEKVKYL